MGGCERSAEIAAVPVPWDASLAADLATIEAPSSAALYRDMIEHDEAVALAVYVNGRRSGAVVYRLDQTEFGREFVIVAGAGHAGDLRLTDAALPLLESIARSLHADTVRFHTNRRGLVRRGILNGYTVSEIVLRKGMGAHGRTQ